MNGLRGLNFAAGHGGGVVQHMANASQHVRNTFIPSLSVTVVDTLTLLRSTRVSSFYFYRSNIYFLRVCLANPIHFF